MSRFNPSKSRHHLVNDCEGIGIDVKCQLLQGTQNHRCISDLYTLWQGPTVTVIDMRSNTLAASSTAASRTSYTAAVSATATKTTINLCNSPSRSTISSVSSTSTTSTVVLRLEAPNGP